MIDLHFLVRRVHQEVNRRGFSFVELTLSVLVLGILVAVASPVYSRSLVRFRAESAAQRIVQDIEQTQQLARQTNASRSIVFLQARSSYTVNGAVSLDHASQPYRVTLGQHPYRVAITSLVTAAQPSTQQASITLVFDRFGMSDQGVSITVQSGTTQRRVDVAPVSGRVSIQ